ncbi:hypothetical protein ACJW30_12G065600 [Castanea mollissima]
MLSKCCAVACCYLFNMTIAVVGMNTSSTATGISSSSSVIACSHFYISNSKPYQI